VVEVILAVRFYDQDKSSGQGLMDLLEGQLVLRDVAEVAIPGLSNVVEPSSSFTLAEIWEMLSQVYTSGYFCQSLQERYPTSSAHEVPSALIEELEAHRRDYERAKTAQVRFSLPMYLLICLESDDYDNDKSTTNSEVQSSSKIEQSSTKSSTRRSKVVGFVKVTPNKVERLTHTADITMGLHPNACGKGLGRRSLEATIERLNVLIEQRRPKALPVVEILYLMVREDNVIAIRMYEKVGFEKVAVLNRDTKISNDLYYDGILMRKFLFKE
jgi:ribosomal protein S18 acetylase RimI-like enzyme